MFPTVDVEEISNDAFLKSNNNRNETDSSDILQNTKSQRESSIKMLFKEFVMCLILALTTYGALHNASSNVSSYPQVVRFFPSNSIVVDWYYGQINNAFERIYKDDISFVMYYAPWDAECQHFRQEFEKAALVLNNQVKFYAVNCWHPDGECRTQNSRLPSWPILMAYTSTSRGIPYKGLKKAHYIVKFLNLIMTPLRRISNVKDLVSILTSCDFLAIGFTPLSETSKHYDVWYQTSFQSREYDSTGEICFGVVTSKNLAIELGVNSIPSARLMLWNDTKDYTVDQNKSWNVTSLLSWIFDDLSKPISKVTPLWTKAYSFNRYINGNPLLLLFTPLNPLLEHSPVYDMMREVSMEYHNCVQGVDTYTSELLKLYKNKKYSTSEDHNNLCRNSKIQQSMLKSQGSNEEQTVFLQKKSNWKNLSKIHEKSKRGCDFSNYDPSIFMSSELNPSFDPSYCKIDILANQIYEIENMQHLTKGTESIHENDPMSSENLIIELLKTKCKLYEFALERGPVIFPSSEHRQTKNVDGLACAKNTSLQFIAMDSVANFHFAENLGIDINNSPNMTAVVILDYKNENQYLLKEDLSEGSIRELVFNFTHNLSQPILRSIIIKEANNVIYAEQQSCSNNSTFNFTQLTTAQSLRRFINTPDQLSVVVVCGGACAWWSVRAAAEAVRAARAAGERVAGAVLDASRHDLPPTMAPTAYPAVLVVPPGLSGESREWRWYPAKERVTAGGVLALAARALPAPRRMRLRLALCAHHKIPLQKTNCLKNIREHITSVIGRNLKYWRRAPNERLRTAFLLRLQQLHRISLQLSFLDTSDITKNFESGKIKSLLKSMDILAKNWDIDVHSVKQTHDVPKTKR